MRSLIFLLQLLVFTALAGAHHDALAGETIQKDQIRVGAGSFTVAGGEGREDRAIDVHYYRPENLSRDSTVLMVMPGAGRNGDDYRNAWIEASEKYGVLVLSPSYPEKHYPEYWSYNLGNMAKSVTLDLSVQLNTNPDEWQFSELAEMARQDPELHDVARKNGLMYQLAVFALADMIKDVDASAADLAVNKDRSAWIYSDFDRIFETARNALALETETYDLFGHSAGGQILHRFALFHPENRANRIVAANSGWYTLPDFNEPFPYGLKETGMMESEIAQAFGSRLVVFLGEKDDEHETRGSLRKTPEAMQQGAGRIQRGEYFFQAAQDAADRMNTPLNWQLEVVPGVGHEYRRMAEAAAKYLYGVE